MRFFPFLDFGSEALLPRVVRESVLLAETHSPTTPRAASLPARWPRPNPPALGCSVGTLREATVGSQRGMVPALPAPFALCSRAPPLIRPLPSCHRVHAHPDELDKSVALQFLAHVKDPPRALLARSERASPLRGKTRAEAQPKAQSRHLVASRKMAVKLSVLNRFLCPDLDHCKDASCAALVHDLDPSSLIDLETRPQVLAALHVLLCPNKDCPALDSHREAECAYPSHGAANAGVFCHDPDHLEEIAQRQWHNSGQPSGGHRLSTSLHERCRLLHDRRCLPPGDMPHFPSVPRPLLPPPGLTSHRPVFVSTPMPRRFGSAAAPGSTAADRWNPAGRPAFLHLPDRRLTAPLGASPLRLPPSQPGRAGAPPEPFSVGPVVAVKSGWAGGGIDDGDRKRPLREYSASSATASAPSAPAAPHKFAPPWATLAGSELNPAAMAPPITTHECDCANCRSGPTSSSPLPRALPPPGPPDWAPDWAPAPSGVAAATPFAGNDRPIFSSAHVPCVCTMCTNLKLAPTPTGDAASHAAHALVVPTPPIEVRDPPTDAVRVPTPPTEADDLPRPASGEPGLARSLYVPHPSRPNILRPLPVPRASQTSPSRLSSRLNSAATPFSPKSEPPSPQRPPADAESGPQNVPLVPLAPSVPRLAAPACDLADDTRPPSAASQSVSAVAPALPSNGNAALVAHVNLARTVPLPLGVYFQHPQARRVAQFLPRPGPVLPQAGTVPHLSFLSQMPPLPQCLPVVSSPTSAWVADMMPPGPGPFFSSAPLPALVPVFPSPAQSAPHP
jgi:hypothetical protein